MFSRQVAYFIRRLAKAMPRRHALADDRGIAAIEFALLLPFLLVLYLGSTELTLGIMVNRQVALTANTVANLVSQYTSISTSGQMPDILNASVQIFAPNTPALAKIVVSFVTIDSKGKATVSWSQTLNGTARVAGSTISLPAALDVPNTNLVFSEASYTYVPSFNFVPLGTINLYASIYMPPRNSTTITLVS